MRVERRELRDLDREGSAKAQRMGSNARGKERWAGIPAGMPGSFESVTGGIAALDHRLPDGMPPASLWGRPGPSTPVCPHPGGIRACSRRLSLATPPGIQCEVAVASRRDASVEARGHSIDSSSHRGGSSDARHEGGGGASAEAPLEGSRWGLKGLRPFWGVGEQCPANRARERPSR